MQVLCLRWELVSSIILNKNKNSQFSGYWKNNFSSNHFLFTNYSTTKSVLLPFPNGTKCVFSFFPTSSYLNNPFVFPTLVFIFTMLYKPHNIIHIGTTLTIILPTLDKVYRWFQINNFYYRLCPYSKISTKIFSFSVTNNNIDLI